MPITVSDGEPAGWREQKLIDTGSEAGIRRPRRGADPQTAKQPATARALTLAKRFGQTLNPVARAVGARELEDALQDRMPVSAASAPQSGSTAQ